MIANHTHCHPMERAAPKKCRRHSRDESYKFEPFKVKTINYKTYGMFDQGINMYPRARSGHRIVCHGSDLFCFGGYTPVGEDVQGQMFQEFWRYNTFTNKWKLVFGTNDDLPQQLASHSMCMHGDKVVVYGGTGIPFGAVCSNSVHVLCPYARPRPTIAKLETTGTPPSPQYGQAILVHYGGLYVVGGTTGHNYSFDVHRLCLRTLVWECLSPPQDFSQPYDLGRYRHEIVTDGQRIYVLGGGTAEHTFPMSTMPAFCLTQNVWQQLQTLPDASGAGVPKDRKCHSCVNYRNDEGDVEVIIAGGSLGDRRAYRDIWRLNLRTLRWCLLRTAQLPKPLLFHDAAYTSNGIMYVFGGIEKTRREAPVRTNAMHSVWVRVPKLSEMCFEAMITQQPGLCKVEGSQLRQAGVPERFVQRMAVEAPREENFDL